MPKNNMIQPDEGDIVWFWYESAGKGKFAINLEPKNINKNKPTFNGVITTSQNVDNIYPYDYLLPDGTMEKPTKIICDQIFPIPKLPDSKIKGRISAADLEEIRKKAAASIGINYNQINI
jgi:mRNA-degrading endonuclease toxin of MazEF toxin-antitoxin module